MADADTDKVLCRWKQFAVRQARHSLPDGRVIQHTQLDHPGAVVILPLTADNQLVLVNQYRPSVGRWLLEFPAGTLESNESILACAKRELAEEVKLRADTWQSLGEILPAPGFCNEVLHAFMAKDLMPAEGQLDDDEVIEVVTLPLVEFEKQLATGALVDAKTMSLYSRAKAMDLL